MKKLVTKILGTVLVLGAAADIQAQTCKAPQPTICVRSCWGARASSCVGNIAALTRAIVHHTENANDFNVTTFDGSKARMRATQGYHMDSLGWCDIGYHFTVDKFGNIFEARGGSMTGMIRGAHDGCNADSFGFSCLGNFNPGINVPPTVMRAALYDVIAWRMPTGWSPYGSGTYCGVTAGRIDGHRVVSTKTCPGDNIYQYITTNYTGGEARTGVASRRACSIAKTARTVDNPSATFVGIWTAGSSSTDKYGTDYRFHSTAPVSEPATWSTALNTTATWNVRAWWPQGANRSTTAPYIVAHNAGSTTVNKNQQTGGGAWQLLGSWSMGGTKTVQLSCWTTTGFVVVADAVSWD